MFRILFFVFFVLPFLALVLLIPPSEYSTVLGYKPVPKNAVQLGRYKAPEPEAEMSPLQELRKNAARTLAAWLYGPPKKGGRFEMTYEGTKAEAEGLQRVPKGELNPVEPEVWTTVPEVE